MTPIFPSFDYMVGIHVDADNSKSRYEPCRRIPLDDGDGPPHLESNQPAVMVEPGALADWAIGQELDSIDVAYVIR